MAKGSRQKMPGAFVVNRVITYTFQVFGRSWLLGRIGPAIASGLSEQKAPGSQNGVGHLEKDSSLWR
jgi:hypothetical protein